MKRITFLQVSSKLLNKPYKDTIADQFYEGIYKYKTKDGYWKGEHYWEIPTWIAEIDGCLDKKYFQTELFIFQSDADYERINKLQTDYILFSIMDVNKAIYEKLAELYTGSAELIAGHYCAFNQSRVKLFETVSDFAKYLGISYVYRKDFKLFKGEKTIPRLTLSTGCKHHCKFCTIPHNITELKESEIYSQIWSFRPLHYRLIYIADATFGQASNYAMLHKLYVLIKYLNPEFEGFIIQTTAFQLSTPAFINKFFDLHIKIVEIGMETFNNSILKRLHKPATERLIYTAIRNLYELGIKVILNVIIGLPNENRATYQQTLEFLKLESHKIYSLNIYNLALYEGTELDKELDAKNTDRNELETRKSFYTAKEQDAVNYFYEHIFILGLNIISKP